jgi:predicted metal-dependent hydrolase
MTPTDPLQLNLFAAAEPAAPEPASTRPLRQPDELRRPPGTTNSRRIKLGDHTIDYLLRRSKRRSIGFMINDDGLRVTAPKWATIADIERAIGDKQRWILNKLHERRERVARGLPPPMQWCDGATLPYLGRRLTLKLQPVAGAGVSYDEDRGELTVSLPPDATELQLKERVHGWLQLQAKTLFGQRLPLYAERLGVSYQSFALSAATTQWGSCTSRGRIRLNWRLIHFSLPLIDYVVAHELAHLREMNHSPRFWATVQSVFPDFTNARSTLREQARQMLPQL